MKRSLAKVFVLLLVLTPTAFGQYPLLTGLGPDYYEVYDFDFIGGGARAEGMGNAYLAISDDVMGGSWNPAGVWANEKLIIGAGWAFMSPKGFSSTVTPTAFLKSDHTQSLNDFDGISFIAPIRIKGHPFVGSFNYTRNFGVYEFAKWAYSTEYIGASWDGTEYTMPVTDTGISKYDGSVYSVNLALATRLYQNISFGVAANIYTGEAIRTDRLLQYVEDSLYHSGQFVDVYHDWTVVDTNKFSGFNVTVGFKYNGEKVDAGIVLRAPFSLNQKYNRSIFRMTEINEAPFETQTDTTYFGDRLTKYDVPMVIGGGIAYKLRENFLVAGDAEYRNFSGSKVSIRESITINPEGTNEETFVEVDPQWNNVFAFRLGTEYLKQTGLGEIPLRLGFGYSPIPAPNYDADGVSSKAVKYKFSVGSGIHWEQISFDFAYTYSTLDREMELLSTTYENRNHDLTVSFTGVF